MKSLRQILRDDPDALDRLIKLMSFVRADEMQLGRKWTDMDWKCMSAVASKMSDEGDVPKELTK